MKGKQLRKAVLLGIAMSMAVWTTGMAEYPITGPIIDNTHNDSYEDHVTVTNEDKESAAIQVTDKEVSITTTGDGYDIKLASDGSGIRTEGGKTGSTVTLTSSGDNEIYFNRVSDAGDGITVDDASTVNIETAGQNHIHAGNFKDLGNQYMANFKAGYRQCATEGCTGRVKITGPNSRYCKKCARNRELEKYKKYNEKR